MIEVLQDPSLFRLLLVLSVGVAFAVYTRLHLVGGGSVTGGYVAILVVTGDWSTLLGSALVTGLTLLTMRGFILRVLGLPRSWQFTISVFVGALMSVILTMIVPSYISLGEPFGLAMTFGAFVIPGLIAYDVSHQGFPQTVLALTCVAGITLVICVPVFLVLQRLPSGTPDEAPFVQGIPPDVMPFAVVAVILVGAVLRFALGLRSGGFIGALFIVEFFSPAAFLTVGAAALTTQVLMWAIERRVMMTGRQRGMIALMLGALVAWAGLYWASAYGWLPAQEANLYVLSPLLATGLMAADMGRRGSDVVRTFLGTGLSALILAVLLWAADSLGLGWSVLALVILALGLIPGVLALREPWRQAERSGKARLADLGRDTGIVKPPA